MERPDAATVRSSQATEAIASDQPVPPADPQNNTAEPQPVTRNQRRRRRKNKKAGGTGGGAGAAKDGTDAVRAVNIKTQLLFLSIPFLLPALLSHRVR